MTQSPRDYLDAALAIMQEHALSKTALDWERARHDALAQSDALNDIAATYPIIQNVIRRLGDRHSYFLTSAAVQRELDGQVEEIGLLVAHPSGVVIQVLPGSPAATAGIHVGDDIEAIDAIPVAAWEGETFSARLRAQEMTLTLRDADGQDPRSLTLQAAPFLPTAAPQGRMVSPTIGYVAVPGMHGSAAQAQPYAEQMQTIIRAGDQAGVRGWIVDLRRNTGGNMWPMLAGLGPLLGDGTLGAFVYPDGATEDWTYHQGQAALDGWTMMQVEQPYTLQQPGPAIAVLVSRYTRSSGELVALAFHGDTRTRFFGEATAGVPTSIAPFALGDGAMIMLTVARGADHTGQTFDAALVPDQPIPMDWHQLGTATDPVMAAAAAWLTDNDAATQYP